MTEFAVALVPTSHGDARVHVAHPSGDPVGLLMLGHGAGGGVTAHNGGPPAKRGVAGGGLGLATEEALRLGFTVVLVEQPYRVAGRKAPAPPAQVDAAWSSVVSQVRIGGLADVPLIVGGRSFGGRVACRTSDAVGASGVLCLAFPLHPPGRPEKSRLAELTAVTVPTLVVQGSNDPFGVPDPKTLQDGVTLVVVTGDHSLKKEAPAIRTAISTWLTDLIPGA
ncbi:alpha/beta hydrolase [Aeromicrobium panaciterrae]|uniref:alpha/beta hydrolase family protein n=1 Tax=Aeromicrobium panaciterrae TaxID=363861 RepID=UPI0031DB000E